VEAALARAIDRASEAGRWDVVAQLARELEARTTAALQDAAARALLTRAREDAERITDRSESARPLVAIAHGWISSPAEANGDGSHLHAIVFRGCTS
jgi:hypothetical protein